MTTLPLPRWALYQAEGLLCGSWLRKKALAECMKHIHYEVQGAWVPLCGGVCFDGGGVGLVV